MITDNDRQQIGVNILYPRFSPATIAIEVESKIGDCVAWLSARPTVFVLNIVRINHRCATLKVKLDEVHRVITFNKRRRAQR